MQDLARKVEWRNGLPLHPEEAEIEDAGNLKLDWLIDITDLELGGKEDKSAILDDASVKSFGDNSFFAKSVVLEQGDKESQDDNDKPITASHNSDSDDEEEGLVTDTTDANAQSSQGVEDYGRSSAFD